MRLGSIVDWVCPVITRNRGAATDCVLELDEPPKRADPALYSQEEQLAAGNDPTWDNPHINFEIEEVGGNVDVTIQNISPETTAANVEVTLEASEWGIGFETEDVGTQTIRSIIPGGQETLQYPRPEDTGAYFVTITFTNDRNLMNNYGESAPQYLYFQPSPVTAQHIQVPIKNETSTAQQYAISAYSGTDAVTISNAPDTVDLNPDEEGIIVVSFMLSEEAEANEQYPVTIMAENNQEELVGGATVIIRTGGVPE